MPKRYSPEFRHRVLELLKTGKTVSEVAFDLGVSSQTIYNWRRQDVVRRLLAPPAAPVLVPRAANRSEHVAAHHVRAAWTQQQVPRAGVRVVQRLVEMPVMELDTAAAEGMLEALVGSSNKAVERDRHVACGCAHVRVEGATVQKSSHLLEPANAANSAA